TNTSSAAITIDVNDLNESPIIVDQGFNIDENSPNSTSVGTVVATDPESAGLTYSITAGNTNSAFAINGSTGEITVNASSELDFETTPSYALTVEVTDGTNTSSATITVDINDIVENQAPTVQDGVLSVDENVSNGTPVGSVVLSDPDADPLTVTIIAGNTASAFAIDDLGEITVNDSSAIDFEVNPSFTLTVQADDGSLTDTGLITVNVTDQNDIPVIGDQNFAVDENTPNGNVVGQLIASDADGDNLIFSITAGNELGAFTLSNTGELTIADAAILDFETNPQFVLAVEVSDGSVNTSANITVDLNDINESPVVVDQTLRVDQSSANGTSIGVIEATDPEDNALTFTILSGNTNGVFALNPTTGELTVNNSTELDFDTTPDYTLSVDVSDEQISTVIEVGVRVTTLERDRLALNDLFNSTNGPAWTASSNWGGTTVDDTWTGIRIENGRVVEVQLPGNNIQGDVPESFGDLTGLRIIDLSDNAITSIPDVSSFPALQQLRLESNKLGFADLITNKGAFTFTYAPQKEFGVAKTDTLEAGADQVLISPLEEAGNQYQWIFNGNEIAGATESSYQITGLDFAQMGDYTVSVTNTELSDLTITTATQTVLAETDIFGTVFEDDLGNPLDRGEVTLYRIQSSGPYDSTSTVDISTTGAYIFEEIVLGDFVLRVLPHPDDTTILQTYYVRAIDWLDADTLQLRTVTDGIDITAQARPEPPTGGTGKITGELFQEVPDEEAGRLEARRRVRRAGCSLSKRRSSGRSTEDIFDLVAYTETDDQGQFSFGFLPDGEYRLNIQFPGVPMDESTTIDFVVGAGGDVEDNEFVLEAVVTDEGIQVTVQDVLGRLKPFVRDLSLYPNPTEGKLTLQYSVNRKVNDLFARVYTVAGFEVINIPMQHQIGKHEVLMDLNELSSGIYIVTISDSQEKVRYNLKITKK
ncbi:MAG: cadherin domain-containing protein, partial [Cyclobacteriaceae bacterium]|nr:cadherin domain-containing protein [Cyclobacteriaceae bacterium HetDA_MAG_MS6]